MKTLLISLLLLNTGIICASEDDVVKIFSSKEYTLFKSENITRYSQVAFRSVELINECLEKGIVTYRITFENNQWTEHCHADVTLLKGPAQNSEKISIGKLVCRPLD